MHLSRWSSILPIAIALTACSDSLTPDAFAGAYSLNDINGRALPTYELPTPGLTRTIRAAGLTIDFRNVAELTQEVTQFDGTQVTLTSHFTYRVKGQDLIFAFSPPCVGDCMSPPTGRLTSTDNLELNLGSVETPIIYHFHRITIGIMNGN